MVPLERASRPMCAACFALSEFHEEESPEPVLVAPEVPEEVEWQDPSSELPPPITDNRKHDDSTIQSPQTAFVPVADYNAQSRFAELVFVAGILCFAGAGICLLIVGFALVTYGKLSEMIQTGAASIGFAIAGLGFCAVSSFLSLCVWQSPKTYDSCHSHTQRSIGIDADHRLSGVVDCTGDCTLIAVIYWHCVRLHSVNPFSGYTLPPEGRCCCRIKTPAN